MREAARRFWFDNERGHFKIGQACISRSQIQAHGGPAPEYDRCAVCQGREWLSRVQRRDLFRRHPGAKCPTEIGNASQCARQGDEAWTMYWQNFRFAEGCDPALDAPRALLLLLDEPTADLWNRWRDPTCDAWMLGLRRKFAQACQVEVVRSPDEVKDWTRYDFLFFMNTGNMPFSKRPPVPILMYGHDMWRGDFQAVLDRLRPEYFLTPCPSAWRRNFKFAQDTGVRFEAIPASDLFTRPNLDDRRKNYDLLVVGASKHPEFHAPRRELTAQIKPLASRYRVGFHLVAGGARDRCPGPVDGRDLFLNKWSGFLGSARYVVFGALGGRAEGILGFKYFECLGSGAVPILPDSPELPLLGVEPMVHYIPLSEIWRDNARLEHLLTHYDRHRPIAQNAVRWHQENADRLLFDGFEAVIREVTEHRYPKRLV